MDYSLKEMANHIAHVDFRDPEEVHVKLRNPMLKLLLTPKPGRSGATVAAIYPWEEMIKARLFLALVDLNFGLAEIGQVIAQISSLDSINTIGTVAGQLVAPPSFNGATKRDGVSNLIRGTQQGESWVLRIRFTRTADGRAVSAWMKWASWDDPKADLSALVDIHYGESLIGVTFVPASDLIRPLLPVAGA